MDPGSSDRATDTPSCHSDGIPPSVAAPAVRVPYQSALFPASRDVSSPFARPVVEMNRSWSWQMQSHRNYLRLSDTVYSTGQSFQHPSSNTTTMDPTTLVTFLFKAPPEARTVELLGSWDNFTHPYLMEHDRRRGAGFWSGCFKFENIIFDGDSSGTHKPRTGGLKQGGTYWYFYRLNDEAEAYDDTKQYTMTCPLLPGQPVNVMEVPIEVHEVPPRARSVSMDVAVTIGHLPSAQTLNPSDKFKSLDPPPISRVHGRCLSDYALSGRLENERQALRSLESIPSPPGSPTREPYYPLPPENRSIHRYYSDGNVDHARISSDYFEGRGSFNSQRSWHSSTPSFAHSSNYEEYGYSTNAFDLTPVPEAPSSRDGLDSRASYVDTPFDFGFQENSSGSWVEDVEPWLLTPDPQPPVMSEFSSGDNDTTNCAYDQWTPYHHWSTHELQAEGHFSDAWTLPEPLSPLEVLSTAPRPHTAHGEGYRTPLHSWPTEDLTKAGHFGDEWNLPEAANELEDEDDYQPRNGPDAFDVLSPSFSAATISSVGVGTPYRLSLGPSGAVSAHGTAQNNDSSIREVAERLRSLSAEDLDRRPRMYESEERALSTYTLPQPDATPAEIVQVNTKLTSPPPSIAHELTLPSIAQQTTAGSLEDDIFSALSF